LPVTRCSESFYRGLLCFSDHVRLSCHGDNIGARLPDRRIHPTTGRLVSLKLQTRKSEPENFCRLRSYDPRRHGRSHMAWPSFRGVESACSDQQKRKGPSPRYSGPARPSADVKPSCFRRSNYWQTTHAKVSQPPIFVASSIGGK
jgi:hypothetical protein